MKPTPTQLNVAWTTVKEIAHQPAPSLRDAIFSGDITAANAAKKLPELAVDALAHDKLTEMVQNWHRNIESDINRALDAETKPAEIAKRAEEAPAILARLQSIVDRFGYDPVVGTNPSITRGVRDAFEEAIADVRALQQSRDWIADDGALAWVAHGEDLARAKRVLAGQQPLDLLIAEGIPVRLNTVEQMAQVQAEADAHARQERLRSDPEISAEELADARSRKQAEVMRANLGARS